jgi:hypothetical protein
MPDTTTSPSQVRLRRASFLQQSTLQKNKTPRDRAGFIF